MLDAALLDALRTRPHHAPAWHALHDAAPTAKPDRARYAEVLEQQTVGLSSDAPAQWLRAGLLFMLTHEDHHLLAMAAQLPSLEEGKLTRLAVLRLLLSTYALNKLSGHQETSDLLGRLRWHEHLADAATQLAQSGAWPDRPVITQPHERRVLLLCSELSTLSHPPTRLAWEQARLLKQMGYEVRILSPQETQCPDLALHCGAPITPSLQPRRKSEWQETLGHDLKVWASDPSTPMERRWTELHAQIATFQPGLVLCIGMGSPAQSLLAPLVPVVTLNTIGVPLGGPADVQLLSRPEAWTIPGQALQFAYRSSVEQAVISA
ncbi:MAG TPA: hypothetical protein VK195_14160, partial [Burkholderiaceae bacterium]|nr:hypothetical protein [Burkholderiaceae bacterium]